MPDISLDTTHGIRGLLVSFIVIVALYIVKDIIKGIWTYVHRNLGPSRNEFIILTKALQANSELLLQQKLINEKMATDVRRIYLFLKVISGKNWPSFRKQVEEIEKELIS